MSQQRIKFVQAPTQTPIFKDLEIGEWFVTHSHNPEPCHKLVLFLKVADSSAMRFCEGEPNALIAAAHDRQCVRCYPTITVPTL